MKHFISKPLAKKAKLEEPAKLVQHDVPIEDFPEPMGCLMIFGGSKAYDDKHRLKAAYWEVHAAKLIVPRYLRWSEFSIVFDPPRPPG